MRKRLTFASVGVILALSAMPALRAVEPEEPEGATHGFPALYDINGQKLANGEFRQWIDNERLHVVITYKFPDGRMFEEKSLFRQQPELIQEKWSWKEANHGQTQREFAVDFVNGTAMARTAAAGENFSGKIDIEPGRTFAGFGFTLALSNLRDRLVKGESVELKAIAFTPKPRVVTVNVSHVGVDRIEMGGRVFHGDNFTIRPDLPAIAKWLVHVPDNHIWLTNSPAATFLRWEGPIVLPSDPIVRVDRVSDDASSSVRPDTITSR